MKCINKALLNTLNSRDLLITVVALIFPSAVPWACPGPLKLLWCCSGGVHTHVQCWPQGWASIWVLQREICKNFAGFNFWALFVLKIKSAFCIKYAEICGKSYFAESKEFVCPRISIVCVDDSAHSWFSPPVLCVNSAQLKLILIPLMVSLQSGFYSFGFFDLN